MNGKIILIVFIFLIFSGCIDPTGRSEKVPVMYADVSVEMQDNKTVITNIDAHSGVISKLKAPGMLIPKDFPAIYLKVYQPSGGPGSPLYEISEITGDSYNGPGNYSLVARLGEARLNKSDPLIVFIEIYHNESKRLGRTSVLVNWTE
ncbi:MAG TPA: hypothetical protein VN316_02635 [candidate division Zixibacteria bacterium]|nr:hypothetical protein [candidate division Zixibacteria bacterium]